MEKDRSPLALTKYLDHLPPKVCVTFKYLTLIVIRLAYFLYLLFKLLLLLFLFLFSCSGNAEEVFSDTQPLIRSVLDGFNVCIFAYGQTGSGKTFTMVSYTYIFTNKFVYFCYFFFMNMLLILSFIYLSRLDLKKLQSKIKA